MVSGKGQAVKEINRILKRYNLDALLLFSLENLRYLSGFTGSFGFLLATRKEWYFLTDSRYTLQARTEVSGYLIKELKGGEQGLIGFLARKRFKRLGFESAGITYRAFRKMQSDLPLVKFVPIEEELDRLRLQKSRREVSLLKKSIRVAEQGLKAVTETIREGITERELALDLEYRMKDAGAEEKAFEIIVLSGSRSALPHGKPGQKRVKEGELLLVDFGAKVDGYFSDETCTYILGKATRKQRAIYQIVKDAHDLAIEAVRPGLSLKQLDAVARGYIEKAGYGKYFGHSLGHGVGLAIHEEPRIAPLSKGTVETGMVFTIEPGIYIPRWGGVRIEDMVLVRPDGGEVLTGMPKGLIIL